MRLSGGICGCYYKTDAEAEKLFDYPDVRSVKLIGPGRQLTRQEIMSLPKKHPTRMRLEREEEAKLEQQRQKARDAADPAKIMGIKPTDRFKRIQLIRTEEGIKEGVPPWDYSTSGRELIKLYEKGLIKGIKK